VTSSAITEPYAAVAMKHASTSPSGRSGVVKSITASSPTLRQLSTARMPTEYEVSGNSPSIVNVWSTPPTSGSTATATRLAVAKFASVITPPTT
jgi:hypothetical protein